MFALNPNINAVIGVVKNMAGLPAMLGGYPTHYRGGCWTGSTRLIKHPASGSMFGYCPAWTEVQAKVRYGAMRLYREDGSIQRLPPGSAWVRVA